jgi:hypothetical protein
MPTGQRSYSSPPVSATHAVATTHPLWLHLRSRRLQWIAPALPVLAGLTAWAASLLVAWPGLGGASARPPVAVGVPLIVAVLRAMTLAGDDVGLERSVPRLSARLRAVHAVIVVVVGSSLIAGAVLYQPEVFGAQAVVRNTIGLFGAVLLTSALLSVQLNWAPAFGYALVVYFSQPSNTAGGVEWWAWAMQPGGWDASWIVAVTLFATGLLAYALRGPVVTDLRRG